MSRAPLTTARIALENIRRKPFRTFGLIFVVALFAFVLFGGNILSASIKNGMESMSKRLGADLMIIPYGYEKQFQGALLRGEPSTFYIDQTLEEKVRKHPGVKNVSSQIFIASLQAYCCSVPVQLVGFDPKTDVVIQPWISGSLHHDLEDGEIIIGHKVSGKVGEDIMFFNKKYKIAARLDMTGMGFDTSVFLTIPTARAMIEKLEISPLFGIKADHPIVSTMMVNVEHGRDPKKIANEILGLHALEYNLDMIMTRNMFTGISARLAAFSYIMYAVSALLWAAAVGVLALIFSMIVNERKREFGLLRILGASRRKLNAILMAEAFMISGAGAAAGVILASLALFPFSTLISLSVRMPFLMPSAGGILLTGAVSLALAFVIGPISCYFSVRRLNKSDISFTVRGN